MRGITGEDEVSDRISELPEPIIHHIFSLMRCSKDVARTASISKNWKRLFDSYPSFDFDRRWFRKRDEEEEGPRGWAAVLKEWSEERERFKEHVERSLAARLDRLERVDRFRLNAEDVEMECVQRWIRAAMAKNVKELEFNTSEGGDLPVDLTQSSSIVSLKVAGSSICILNDLKMVNLRRLSLVDVRFRDADAMKRLEENCPFLEDFRFLWCHGLSHLQISSPKLRRMECSALVGIEMAAPNLETLWYCGRKSRFGLKCSKILRNLTLTRSDMSDSELQDWILMCPLLQKLELHYCTDIEKLTFSSLTLKSLALFKCSEKLRNLTLRGSDMSDSELRDFMCPLLEKLELHDCTCIEKLTISSLTLKSLALFKCSNLDRVEVDAPNLYSFEYRGRVMPFPLIIAPRLSEVKLAFKPYIKGSKFKRENLFWNFDGSRGLKLLAYTNHKMKIFEEPRVPDLYETTVCTMELTASSSKVVKSVDSWLGEHHGQSLVLVSSNGELLKSINELIIERPDSPSCCKWHHHSHRCWRHYIEDVKVSTLDTEESTLYDFTWRSRKTEEFPRKKWRSRTRGKDRRQ